MKNTIYKFIEEAWCECESIMITYKIGKSHILNTFSDYELVSNQNSIEILCDDGGCQIDIGDVYDIKATQDNMVIYFGGDELCMEISRVH